MKYTTIARIFPAIINSAPFFVLYYFMIRPSVDNRFLDLIFTQKLLGDISLSVVLIYLLVQFSRLFSKFIENKIFNKYSSFPTTELLSMSDNYYSPEFKKQLYQKIKQDFNITIPSNQKDNLVNVKRIISEAVTQIRLKVGQGKLVLQHNIEYGFVRNLVGGSVISLIASVANVVIFNRYYFQFSALIISVILFFIYLLIIVFTKPLLINFGRNYAVILLQEYKIS